MQLEVEKNWSELLMVMTEDESGRVRATEEAALMRLWIEDFFIKLLVFKERMEKRIDTINSTKKTPTQ